MGKELSGHYSTRMTSTGRDHLSFLTAHRLNCSLVTETPTLHRALSALVVVTPGGAASWMTFSSFSGSIYSGKMLIASGSLVTCSRFNRETNICLSCEKVELHECLYPPQRTLRPLTLAHLTRFWSPRTVFGTNVQRGVLETLWPQL
jgi:hypothetical protein